MRVQILPFTDERIGAVRAFNERLRVDNPQALQFPESPASQCLPIRGEPDRFPPERYIALDDDMVVRGGYLLRRQDFLLRGKRCPLGIFQLPISEGALDRRFALVGPRLLVDATKRSPLLAAMGIGGQEEPLTKMLLGARWQTSEVPFYFRVVNTSKFLRNISHLRTTRWRRAFFDTLSLTGLGAPPLLLFHRLMDRSRRLGNELSVRVEDRFGIWADELWNEVANQYTLIAIRDSKTLTRLYPETDARFIRIRVAEGTTTVGWVVVMNNQQTAHKHFGAMRLGSIIDGLARDGYAAAVVREATRFLIADGTDLIVTNQAHKAWCSALALNGYIRGPSNYLFAASVELSRELKPFDHSVETLHLTRGDGDGPIHL